MTIAMKSRIGLAAAAFAASLLASAAARSEDFTFTVPVALHALPSAVQRAGVRCEVLRRVPPPAPAAPGNALASGQTGFVVAHGEYHDNVTVRFNATGAPLSEAKGYRCWLYYLDPAGKEESLAVTNSSVEHRQGTTYTPEVRGAIGP